MKLTFKEVGQGDTIILEWRKNGEKKIGLIDCNLKSNYFNSALEYLKITSYKSIDFILLSHPHYDHFSGINELLEYCSSKKILIEYFLHTSYNTIEYLQSAVRGNVAKKSLEVLFGNVQKLIKRRIIKECFYVSDSSRDLIFNEKWKMKFLSPSDKEFSEYNRNKYKNVFEVSQNNSNANLLSTLLSICSERNQIILTSDTVNSVFKRLVRGNFRDIRNNLILGQISHHGAKSDFERNFWKLQSYSSKIPAVFSVGENQYGHPSEEVVKSLQDLNFEVYFTNNNKSVTYTSNSQNISDSLDLISSVAQPTIPITISKDIIFDSDTSVVY